MVKKWMKACCLVAAMIGTAHAAQQTYVVGSGGTYRPFEFENSQKQLEGFDIDIIKAIAKAEGFDIKLVNTPWEGIFATLNTGDRDIIISGSPSPISVSRWWISPPLISRPSSPSSCRRIQRSPPLRR